MPTQVIWISFDLGVRGDYEGLYAWLDEHGAKECGDSLAVLSYRHDRRTVADTIKKEIKDRVKVDQRTRIYIIYRDNEGKNKGEFIFGRRRGAAWAGYAPAPATVDEDT
jgi:hypothetical protein